MPMIVDRGQRAEKRRARVGDFFGLVLSYRSISMSMIVKQRARAEKGRACIPDFFGVVLSDRSISLSMNVNRRPNRDARAFGTSSALCCLTGR